jgi:hypothetical protein
MTATKHNDVPVDPAVQARLLRQLQDTRDAIREIDRLITGRGVGEWLDGRAEGVTLERANAADSALASLRSALRNWMKWEEPPRSPFSYGFVLPRDTPPVTAEEDEAFDAKCLRTPDGCYAEADGEVEF